MRSSVRMVRTVSISGAGSPLSSTSSRASYTFAIFLAVEVWSALAFLYFIGFFVSCDCASRLIGVIANTNANEDSK